MTRFTASALTLAVLAASAAPALAQIPAQNPAQKQKLEQPAPAARQSVMICATDVATRRAYQREHGVQPVFVTAREAVEARRNAEAWSTPRCMTEREYGRLVATANTRAGL